MAVGADKVVRCDFCKAWRDTNTKYVRSTATNLEVHICEKCIAAAKQIIDKDKPSAA